MLEAFQTSAGVCWHNGIGTLAYSVGLFFMNSRHSASKKIAQNLANEQEHVCSCCNCIELANASGRNSYRLGRILGQFN
eukprot:5737650-Amphidinium_carterae.1